LIPLLLFLLHIAPANATPLTHGLSIWTLNVAGGQTPLKINTIHDQIMRERPDIFILTDTRSDGSFLRSQWDWDDYQIREIGGIKATRGLSRNAGLLLGIKKDIPIIQEHQDIEGLNGRLLHVSVKVQIKNKGARFKIIGAYSPCHGSYASQVEFLAKLKDWLQNVKEDWILAGDMNLTVSPNEANYGAYMRHQSAAKVYRELLTHDGVNQRTDWWATRERHLEVDYTRKDWDRYETTNTNPEDSTFGKSIIDRIASTSLFSSIQIRNRPDLFVPGTDHVWVNGQALIRYWQRHPDGDMHRARKAWVERRVRIPRKEEKAAAINKFEQLIRDALESRRITPHHIENNADFDECYHALSEVIISSSSTAFGHRKFKHRKVGKPSNPDIRRTIREIRTVGRIIHAVKNDYTVRLVESDPFPVSPVLREAIEYANTHSTSLEEAARQIGKQKRRLLLVQEKKAAEESLKIRTEASTKRLLQGGSAKRLTGRVTLHTTPTIITKNSDA